MQPRKPKFVSKKTKWEKRRVARRFVRETQGKKPLVEPLLIAPAEERQAALKRGKMVFYDGKQKIELPLIAYATPFSMKNKSRGVFQGALKIPGGARIAVYFFPSVGDINPLAGIGIISEIHFFAITPEGNPNFERVSYGFTMVIPDLGHMLIENSLRGYGLGLKGTSKAERHVRSRSYGMHDFVVSQNFVNLYLKKLGYKMIGTEKKYGTERFRVSKMGNYQPKDDLSKFHRIEAIDPKTGKARIFTFPIQKQ